MSIYILPCRSYVYAFNTPPRQAGSFWLQRGLCPGFSASPLLTADPRVGPQLTRSRVELLVLHLCLQGEPMQIFLFAKTWSATWCGTFVCGAKQGPYIQEEEPLRPTHGHVACCALKANLKVGHFFAQPYAVSIWLQETG